MVLKIVLVAAVFGLAVPAFAQTAAPTSAAPTADQAKPKKPKKFCRAVGATGSHFASSVCKSQEEWAVIDAQTGVGYEALSRAKGN